MQPEEVPDVASLDAATIAEWIAEDPAITRRAYKCGQSVLHSACMCGRADLASVLLQGGADPNLVDECGLAPLHYAMRELACSPAGRELLTMLVKHGADPNASHDPILHTAVALGYSRDDIEFLLSIGCDINQLDGDDCPPWYMAVLDYRLDGSHPPYRIEQLRFLLALGADPDIRNWHDCCLDEELSADQLEELSRDIGKARARLQGMGSESPIADRRRLPDTPGGRFVLGALALPIAGAAVWAYTLTFDYAPLVTSFIKDIVVAVMRAAIFMCFSVSVLSLVWAACTPRWLRARLERDSRRAA